MRIYSIFFFLLCCVSAISAQLQLKEVKSDAVDKFVAEQMRDLQIPGLALAVLEDGKVLKISVYGQANLETGTPVKPESVFIIASLGKQFVAAAILLLQYERFPDDKLSVIVLANLDNRGLARMAVKIAGFYKETLAAPSFSISVKTAQNTFPAKNPVAIEIQARNDDKKAAPRTILEMEFGTARANPFINNTSLMWITPPENQRNTIFPGRLRNRANIP